VATTDEMKRKKKLGCGGNDRWKKEGVKKRVGGLLRGWGI